MTRVRDCTLSSPALHPVQGNRCRLSAVHQQEGEEGASVGTVGTLKENTSDDALRGQRSERETAGGKSRGTAGRAVIPVTERKRERWRERARERERERVHGNSCETRERVGL